MLATVGYLGLATGPSRQRRRVALSWSAFGVAFLLVLLAGAALVDLGVVLSLALGVVTGVVVAVATFLPSARVGAASDD